MHSEPFRSKTRWDSCKKNPGHKQFIPIHNFTRDLLPEGYRYDSIYNLICFTADLTVCLRVKNVSNMRPSEYVFSSFRGKNTTHTGTGFVCRVVTKDISTLCDCPECKDQTGVLTSAKTQDVFSHTKGIMKTHRTEVFIRTAAHVVFDNEEAKSTFIDVFYDDENDRQNSRLLRGYCLSSADVENDISLIKCVTHDQVMSDRLRNSLAIYKKLQSKASISFGVPAELIESNQQGGATNKHLHSKSKTSKPLTLSDKSVELKPVAVYDKSVTSQPIASSSKYVKFKLHKSLSEVTIGSETVDLLHKCHHCRSGSDLEVTDDEDDDDDDDDEDNDKRLKTFFTMTDIVRSVKSKGNMQADDSEEAELENLEVSVHFPDGEISLHNIWRFQDTVKELKMTLEGTPLESREDILWKAMATLYSIPKELFLKCFPLGENKEFLLNQAGIKDVSPDLLVMVVKCLDSPDIIMAEHLVIYSYLDVLTQAEYIDITWKDTED